MSKGDNSPIPQTCPLIDKIISSIHDTYIASVEIGRGQWNEFENSMEKIRRANSDLRDWGNEQYERAENAESELNFSQSKIEDLESQIQDLENQLAEARAQ